MARAKKNTQSFAGIPRVVMESLSYKELSGGAVKMLLELSYQYRGRNNGDLTTAWTVLKEHGWRSKDAIRRARDELLAADLIQCTRQSLRANPGGKCALYALQWLPIDECPGKELEVKATTRPPRKFSIENNDLPGTVLRRGSSSKPVRSREKDSQGRFVSSLKPVRVMEAAKTINEATY